MKIFIFFLIYTQLFFINKSNQPENRTVIFIGGVEKSCSIKRQEELFLMGYGKPKKIITFKYTARVADISRAISLNQNAHIVFFSAGCNLAKEVLLDKKISHKNIYLIEPWAPNEALTFVLEWTKFNTGNVFVGNESQRGKGILKSATLSGSKNHCESLTTVASIIRKK